MSGKACDEIKDFIFKNEDNYSLYKNILIKNLEYLEQYQLINYVNNNPKLSVFQLDSYLREELKHILPVSLMSSILFEIIQGDVETYDDIIERLKNVDISRTLRNIITPNSKNIIVNNFKGKLFPPQSRILNKMVEMEENYNSFKLGDKNYIFNIGILCERIGFGKTYLTSALLSHSPKLNHDLSSIKSSYINKNLKFDNELSKFSNMNIIICNLKTAKEWEKNIINLTDLKLFKITSKKMLDNFISKCNENDIPDVLLIKDGKINGELLVETVTNFIGDNYIN